MRFRLPASALAAYVFLALVVLAAVAVLPGRGPDLPEGMPAMAPGGEGTAPSEAVSAPPAAEPAPARPPLLVEVARRLWEWCRQRLLDPGVLKGALRAGLPAMARWDAPHPAVTDDVQPPSRRMLSGLLRLVGGAEPGRPWTLLAAELPALRHLEVPESGPMVVPVSLLPGPDPDDLSRWQQKAARNAGSDAGPGGAAAPQPPSTLPYDADSNRPQVLIYHTHTSEAYLGAVPASTAARADALAFSDDPQQSIVRVGAAMAGRLRQHGLGVLHLRAVFDRSNGAVNRFFSYAWARKALLNFDGKGPLLAAYPSLRMVVDVHRDHLPGAVGEIRSRVTSTIRGQTVARVLLVVGADHPQARTNHCFALAVADLMDRMYPGLSRGVKLAPGKRYNQDLAPGALLVEIGSTFNTLEEAERAAVLVADVLAEAYRRGLAPEPGRPYRCPVSPP